MNTTTSAQVESLGKIAWKRLKKNRGALVGMWIILCLIVVALFAPLIAPMNPTTQILEYSTKPSFFRGNVLYKINPVHPDQPSVIAVQNYQLLGDSLRYTDELSRVFTVHLSVLAGKSEGEWHGKPLYILGSDMYGRDILSRLIYGARVALMIALIAESISIVIGVLLGALAGFFRGWVDDLIMWVTNVTWSVPTVLLVIAFSVILGNGLWQTFVAIGVSGWVDITRVVRGQFFSLREVEYIEATRALGFGTFRTIFRHMLPNTLGPVTVVATAGFATAIIFEASLSFIGLGVQPPNPSWGSMINDGRGFMFAGVSLELVTYSCLALAITVYAFNLFGDGLRDAVDPKTTQRG